MGNPTCSGAPTGKEVCDGLDNDCDTEIDEGGVCCKPNCVGKTCGSDGCGGYCGDCIAHAGQTITQGGITYTWDGRCTGSGVCSAVFCNANHDTCLEYVCSDSKCVLMPPE